MTPADHPLSIRDVAEATGVNEGTLRMWQTRHGFPSPQRENGGRRRYSPADVDAVREVVRARDQGLSLKSAIERARQAGEAVQPSVFAALRDRFPELQVHDIPKRVLIRMSHAIEDETCVRARRPMLFAAFQRERFYRDARERWRELSRTAERSIVFADFPATRTPRGGPAEVALGASDELMREWVIVCDAPRHAACLAGWERPGSTGPDRVFETVWTVDPAVVRHAARVCAELTRRLAPDLGDDLGYRLADAPPAAGVEVRDAVDLSTRMALYVAGAQA